MRILLVEDHEELAGQMSIRLRSDGFAVDRVETIEDALAALADNNYSIAMLDRRLPDGDGLSLVPKIRTRQPLSRVLILTALDSLDEKVEGLDAGADDYLAKPFHLDEMMARVRASLRRSNVAPPPIIIGYLAFDLETRTIAIRGKPESFHRRELALVETLARRVGRYVRRETLISEIWGYDEEVQPHALTMLVTRTRARLAGVESGADIFVSRGVGYMIGPARSA